LCINTPAAGHHQNDLFIRSPQSRLCVIDVEALLAPVSSDAPSGPDLEYDADFIALETAARGKAEQQFGDTIIAAEDADWRNVKKQAEALLERSKDLRVAMLLTRAETRLGDMEGLAGGLALTTGLLSRYWDDVHPQLDREDNNDPTMRMNVLAPLADPETLLRDIRAACLVASPQHGRVAVRDVLVAAGKLQPAAGAPAIGEGEIAGIMQAAAGEHPQSLQALLDCIDTVQTLETLLTEKNVLAHAPDLRPLKEMLQTLKPICVAALGVPESEGVQNEAQPGVAAAGRPGASGEIRTREDVVRVLDNVCRFIEQTEPSNPAPLLIRRAQRLMSRSFLEIIQDLAPDTVDQIQKLAGVPPE
jgi:type VI secretion system protein ImpA